MLLLYLYLLNYYNETELSPYLSEMGSLISNYFSLINGNNLNHNSFVYHTNPIPHVLYSNGILTDSDSVTNLHLDGILDLDRILNLESSSNEITNMTEAISSRVMDEITDMTETISSRVMNEINNVCDYSYYLYNQALNLDYNTLFYNTLNLFNLGINNLSQIEYGYYLKVIFYSGLIILTGYTCIKLYVFSLNVYKLFIMPIEYSLDFLETTGVRIFKFLEDSLYCLIVSFNFLETTSRRIYNLIENSFDFLMIGLNSTFNAILYLENLPIRLIEFVRSTSINLISHSKNLINNVINQTRRNLINGVNNYLISLNRVNFNLSINSNLRYFRDLLNNNDLLENDSLERRQLINVTRSLGLTNSNFFDRLNNGVGQNLSNKLTYPFNRFYSYPNFDVNPFNNRNIVAFRFNNLFRQPRMLDFINNRNLNWSYQVANGNNISNEYTNSQIINNEYNVNLNIDESTTDVNINNQLLNSNNNTSSEIDSIDFNISNKNINTQEYVRDNPQNEYSQVFDTINNILNETNLDESRLAEVNRLLNNLKLELMETHNMTEFIRMNYIDSFLNIVNSIEELNQVLHNFINPNDNIEFNSSNYAESSSDNNAESSSSNNIESNSNNYTELDLNQEGSDSQDSTSYQSDSTIDVEYNINLDIDEFITHVNYNNIYLKDSNLFREKMLKIFNLVDNINVNNLNLFKGVNLELIDTNLLKNILIIDYDYHYKFYYGTINSIEVYSNLGILDNIKNHLDFINELSESKFYSHRIMANYADYQYLEWYYRESAFNSITTDHVLEYINHLSQIMVL